MKNLSTQSILRYKMLWVERNYFSRETDIFQWCDPQLDQLKNIFLPQWTGLLFPYLPPVMGSRLGAMPNLLWTGYYLPPSLTSGKCRPQVVFPKVSQSGFSRSP